MQLLLRQSSLNQVFTLALKSTSSGCRSAVLSFVTRCLTKDLSNKDIHLMCLQQQVKVLPTCTQSHTLIASCQLLCSERVPPLHVVDAENDSKFNEAAGMHCRFFERRLWCRHLCPIGGMNGMFAKLSMTELRSRQGVCSGEQLRLQSHFPAICGFVAECSRK